MTCMYKFLMFFKNIKVNLSLTMFVMVSMFAITDVSAQDATNTVDVTFTVNMSTLQDTVTAKSYTVFINGMIKGTDGGQEFVGGETISWDANATATLENIGGDLWQGTFQMIAGDILHYKYRYKNNVTEATDDENAFNTASNPEGWDTRGVVINSDTMLPVHYFNDRDDSPTPGEDAPFASESESVTIYFRVNVGAQVQTGAFDPATGKVGMRGSPNFFDNPADWSSTGTYLTNLGGSGDNLFYGGFRRISKTSLASLTGNIDYKFVLEDSDGAVILESDPNRNITPPSSDITAYWRFFNDERPSEAVIVDTELNFEVNVGILEGLGFFNASFDNVSVRGSFSPSWETDNQMTFNNVTGNYEKLNISHRAAVDAEVKYKYYVRWSDDRDDPDSQLYLPGITADGNGWEEPGVTGGADRVFNIANSPTQATRSEFYNGVVPQALLTPSNVNGGAITITFKVDMAPAAALTTSAFKPVSDQVFLFVDTPFFALTNGLIVPGDSGADFIAATVEQREKLRFTDEDADMIYELELPLVLPTLNHIGFRIAYGDAVSEGGTLIANGGGFDAGRRHYQYIQPLITPDGDDADNLPDVNWPATYTMPTLTWQSMDLPWESPPDYSQLSIANEDLENVEAFRLDQNYPNPFNPSTNIRFNLPNAAKVNLTVYNLLGQKVATLIDGKTMNSGTHAVGFNAQTLASGVYIYRIEAGSFVSNKRMTLIK